MAWINNKTECIELLLLLAYCTNPPIRLDQFLGYYALVSLTMAGLNVYDTFPPKAK